MEDIELFTGDERATLIGVLERNRRTFAWKTGGLSTDQLRATLPPSAITLGGLLKHLAFIEDYYFTLRLDAEMPEPWASVDWEATPDYPWSSAADETAEELYATYAAAVARGRAAIDRALERGDLDQPVRYAEGDVRPTVRATIADIVEEYARHTGHADLVRESIDGLVGEDAPRSS
jgi:hypothetical protein